LARFSSFFIAKLELLIDMVGEKEVVCGRLRKSAEDLQRSVRTYNIHSPLSIPCPVLHRPLRELLSHLPLPDFLYLGFFFIFWGSRLPTPPKPSLDSGFPFESHSVFFTSAQNRTIEEKKL